MKEKCLGLIKNGKKCVFIGKTGKKEIIYEGDSPMEILGDLHWDGYISNDYHEYVKTIAKGHITHPNTYEKSMWKIARGKQPIIENESSLFMFSCWIEDKYKSRDVASIIKKFVLCDEFYLRFNYMEKEKGEKKHHTIVEEEKICSII